MLSHLAVTAVTERSLRNFEEKEATARLLGARSCYGTEALGRSQAQGASKDQSIISCAKHYVRTITFTFIK